MPESTNRIDPALPARVADCVAAVGAERVWLAGGPVRDALLRGRSAAGRTDVELDFDFATTVRPQQVVERLGAAAAPREGDLALGAVEARCEAGVTVTFTTLRRDGPYPADSRRPASVEFVDDLTIDAARRDFTINALYARVVDGVVLDPIGSGLRDLDAGILRAIGDANARLFEDPLRILRAIRFASRFGFEIESATREACRKSAERVAEVVPPTRRFDEFDRAFCGGAKGSSALRLVHELGVPFARGEFDNVLQPRALEAFEADADRTLRWAAVLLAEPAGIATLTELQAPRGLVRSVGHVLDGFVATRDIAAVDAARQRACARAPEFEFRVEMVRALDNASPGFVPDRDAFERAVASLDTTRPVTGRDVLAMGVAPGAEVGRILAEVERRLDAEADRTRALAILREVVAARPIKAPPHGRR